MFLQDSDFVNLTDAGFNGKDDAKLSQVGFLFVWLFPF